MPDPSSNRPRPSFSSSSSIQRPASNPSTTTRNDHDDENPNAISPPNRPRPSFSSSSSIQRTNGRPSTTTTDEHEYESRNAGVALDHERLDVYRLALQFLAWATDLIVSYKGDTSIRIGPVCDHLDRASLSILLNIAEGNGKRQMKTRAKFFDDARGSATECAACLDALVAKTVCRPDQVTAGKALLIRIVSMLCKLVERYDTEGEIRDGENADPPDLNVPLRSSSSPALSSSSSFSYSKRRKSHKSSTTTRNGNDDDQEPPNRQPTGGRRQ